MPNTCYNIFKEKAYGMQKIKNSKRTLIFLLLVILLIALAVAAYFFLIKDRKSQTTTSNPQQTEQSVRTNSLDNTNKASGQNQNTASDASDSSDEVSTPTPAPNPGINDTYPITNSHYRISQINNTTYTIDLYAINNGPSQYNEYEQQLKDYKREAISYLTSRYGDISQFNISWSPPNAGDL